jgi:hypothetical protein
MSPFVHRKSLDDLVAQHWQLPGNVNEVTGRVIAGAFLRIEAAERELAELDVPHPAHLSQTRPFWLRREFFVSAAVLIFLIGATCGLQPAGTLDKASTQTLILDGPYRSYAAL